MTDDTAAPGPVDLAALGEELLAQARAGRAGRAARTLPHPVDGLRHTVIALSAGAALDEHESPGSASLHVLRGRTRLVTGGEECAVTAGQISPIPSTRHSLHADEDSIVLLSVAHSHSPGH